MPSFEIENNYKGKIIAGIDEAGRGPWAGPVVAAAVIINRDYPLPASIDDSKKLSKQVRELLYKQITENYIWGVGIISAAEIDQINILQATIKACIIATAKLSTMPGIVLVDGNMKFADPKFKSIVKGDSLSVSIAAASIIAKVYRDKLMAKLAIEFPYYLWQKNAGYGTKEHKEAIKQYGLCQEHRKSFRMRI